MNFRRALLLMSIVVVVVVALVPAARHAMLRAAGTVMVAADPVERGDVGVMPEFGEGADLELADLYRDHMFSRIVLLEPRPTAVDREYARRRVYRDDVFRSTLRQLGVPETAIVAVDAGEGGTTESTQALASWMRMHPGRAIVIVATSHTRRFRRALRRVWPDNVPPPHVVAPRHDPFRADDWWRSRRMLREGLVELQKDALDYLQHPW